MCIVRLIAASSRVAQTLIWTGFLAALASLSLVALSVEALTTYLGTYLGPPLYEEVKGKLAPDYSVALTSRDGETLGLYGVDESRREPLAEVPQTFADLLMAFEDARFHAHNGVDRARLLGALMSTLTGRLEGGSTLTMQLAKMIKGDGAQTLRRKLDDMALALAIEKHHSKEEIMRLYADHAYFGSNVHGLKLACEFYFNRPDCKGLELQEAAYLVGLVKAPTKYANNFQLGLSRRDTVLMVALGPETPPQDPTIAEFGRWFAAHGWKDLFDRGLLRKDAVQRRYGQALIAQALNTPLVLSKTRQSCDTPYLRDAAVALAAERIGSEQLQHGANVTLTIAADAQKLAAQALEQSIATAEKESAEIGEGLDGGVVVLNAQTGEVLALVGGRDYGQSQVPFALRPIQVGSAVKPFVYALGFETGVLSPGKKVVDGRFCVNGWCPKNFGNKYHGALPVEEALAKSLNSVAVRTAAQIGVPTLYSTFRALGFTSPLEQNLTMALGASEVTLLELAQAYTAVFDGAMKPARLLQSATTRLGAPLYAAGPVERFQVYDPSSVSAVRVGMRKALLPGGTAVRLGNALAQRWSDVGVETVPEVACKTGTTNESLRVGMMCVLSDSDYGAPLVVGVYLGKRVPTPLGEAATGGRLAGPAMQRILLGLTKAKLSYRGFFDVAPPGPSSHAPEALEASPKADRLQAPVAYEANGPDWLRDLHDLGVVDTTLAELNEPLALHMETHEQMSEQMKDKSWKKGNGLQRAVSIVSKIARFVAVRGLSARRAAHTDVMPETNGFSIVEEQPDRVVTRRYFGRGDVSRVRVFVTGGVVNGLDLIAHDGRGETWVRMGKKLHQAEAVRVHVPSGSFAQAWMKAGLDAHQLADLRTLFGGSTIDIEHIRKGFEVSLLLAGRAIVAAHVSAPNLQGIAETFAFGRLSAGVYDRTGAALGNKLWPVKALDAETFTSVVDGHRVTTHAVFKTARAAAVESPTRARIVSVDAFRHSMLLENPNGAQFSLLGVRSSLVEGDIVSGGEVVGQVDGRGLLVVDAEEGMQGLMTLASPAAAPEAKAHVEQLVRQLEFAINGPKLGEKFAGTMAQNARTTTGASVR